MQVRFVSWDFRIPPSAEELATAIRSFDAGPVYAVALDVGTDDHILVLADQPLTTQLARRYWMQ
jgi:hypothetical protein